VTDKQKVNPLRRMVLRGEDELKTSVPVQGKEKKTIHKTQKQPMPVPFKGTIPLEKDDKTYILSVRSLENMAWHGIYAIYEKRRSHKVEQICETPLYIKSLIFDVNTSAQAVEICFLPSGRETWVSQTWDKGLLVTGHINSFCWKKLVQSGFNVSSIQLPKLQEYIRYVSDIMPMLNQIPINRGLDRPGWFGNEYVTAGWKTNNAPLFIGPEDPTTGAWVRSGNKKAFIETYKKLVIENPFFAIIAGYYLSGFLLNGLGGSENFLLCLLGDSTLGKTLAAKFCIAMKGRPNVFATFDSTEGSLKSMMVQHNDGCMVIDEVGTSAMTDRQKARFIYDVSSGKERLRLSKGREDKYNTNHTAAFKYCLLLTGEESLLPAPTAGGQTVRYTEIVFDREDRVLWENIKSGSQADEYLRFFEENHGFLAPIAIEKIKAMPDEYRKAYAKALQSLNLLDDDAKAIRKHKLFAGAFAGVKLLYDCLSIPWEPALILQRISDLVVSSDRYIAGFEVSEQFLNALSSTLHHFRDNLHLDVNGVYSYPDRNPVIGKYAIVNENHEFVLDRQSAQVWAKRVGVDLNRFLSWAEKKGYLQTYPSAGRKYPRQYSRFKVGDTNTFCYKFTFTVDTKIGDGSEDSPF